MNELAKAGLSMPRLSTESGACVTPRQTRGSGIVLPSSIATVADRRDDAHQGIMR